MRARVQWLGIVAIGVILAATSAQADVPLGTAFTYQGQLKEGGAPVNSTADLEFALWDADEDGSQVGLTVRVNNVDITDGLFTVEVDFGVEAYNGAERWVEIAVRTPHDPGDTEPFTTLSPRQKLTAAPYATHALRNWSFNGNAGTDPNTDFIGTTDEQPLIFRVDDEEVASLEWDAGRAAASPNVWYGHAMNRFRSTTTPSVASIGGRTVSGGGTALAPNVATDDFATVGGGEGNQAGNYNGTDNDAICATVAGGCGNTASGGWSAVPGGQGNVADGQYSFAAGRQAEALHDGCFVWADSTNSAYSSTGADQFRVRATNGVEFMMGVNASYVVSATNPVLHLINRNDAGWAWQSNTFSSLQLGLYNPSPTSTWGIIPPNTYRSMLGCDRWGHVGSLTNNSGGPVFRNLLDDGNGNAGIGTTTPAGALHVKESGIARVIVESPDDQAGIGFWSDGVGDVAVYSPDGTDDLRFWVGGADRMHVGADGRVGIGTGSPTTDLHVMGYALFDTPVGQVQISGPAGVPGVVGLSSAGHRRDIRFHATGMSLLAGDSGTFPPADNGITIRENGYVGIRATAPSSPLTVAGIVESTSGGIKFPDGTIQTSAATGGLAWSLTGNAGTTAGVNFLGTTDNQALEVKVNNARALRIEPPTAGTWGPNLIGGVAANVVTAGANAATIAGGGDSALFNLVADDAGTVGGGAANEAGVSDGDPTNQPYATVGGGFHNRATNGYATAGGGADNTSSGTYAVTAGGAGNTASADLSAIGGGEANTASGGWSTVAGGHGNQATGQWSAIPGGGFNIAQGDYGFAAGFWAQALHDGSFVWADSTGSGCTSTAANQFLICASGGVGIQTNAPTRTLDVNGSARIRGLPTGSYFPVSVDSNGVLYVMTSSRRYKTDIEPIALDPAAVLKLQPVCFAWRDSGQPDIGLIAEDVADLVPELVIPDVDGQPNAVRYDKVALGLLEVVKSQRTQIGDLQQRVERLEALVSQLAREADGGAR